MAIIECSYHTYTDLLIFTQKVNDSHQIIIETYTVYNCDGSCRKGSSLVLCHNKCQSANIPCDGACPEDMYPNCENTCTKTSEIYTFELETWMCNGRCQDLDKPCNGKCVHSEWKQNCQNKCEKPWEQTFYMCNIIQNVWKSLEVEK